MHFKALSLDTQKTWRMFHEVFTQPEIHLAGGTAVALHLGHRISDDLDFFIAGQVFDVEEKVTRKILDIYPGLMVIHRDKENFVGNTKDGKVKISCLNLPKEFLLEPLQKEDGIQVAALEDLLTMKVIALIQRGKLRDFLDLWAIEQQTDLKVEYIFPRLSQRYPSSAPNEIINNFLLATGYFEDADKDEMPILLNCDISKKELKGYWLKRQKELEILLGESNDFTREGIE